VQKGKTVKFDVSQETHHAIENVNGPTRDVHKLHNDQPYL